MEYESSRVKRRRSASITSSSASSSSSSPSPSRSPSPAPVPKYHRTDHSLTPTDTPFTCNLPPTCSQPHTITSYATEEELLRHQETFHRWVCRTPIKDRSQPTPPDGVPTRFVSGNPDGKGWKECGKVFPDERLLHLHQTETHDPIAQTRQARGEKIFECFVPPPGCVKTFANPARRRRHLIDKHRYPEQYFFAITNHGVR
ncbi:hypothetical protein DB88DRAFT_481422 [Papiliotrema laurentii]|uniref:C2H2-type domain-containing protein n=1 Tax=Papiliotrema laurentii TaxID=5418 RepID=A0AAD9FU95_PAPLA|nr:hypothetical protein DB88DRAFT_481422 [Papiliotrema laurentii]